MKTYKCNKCGTIVQIVASPDTGEEGYLQVCLAPFEQRTSGICGGQLLPIKIKPAPCKDCD